MTKKELEELLLLKEWTQYKKVKHTTYCPLTKDSNPVPDVIIFNKDGSVDSFFPAQHKTCTYSVTTQQHDKPENKPVTKSDFITVTESDGTEFLFRVVNMSLDVFLPLECVKDVHGEYVIQYELYLEGKEKPITQTSQSSED